MIDASLRAAVVVVAVGVARSQLWRSGPWRAAQEAKLWLTVGALVALILSPALLLETFARHRMCPTPSSRFTAWLLVATVRCSACAAAQALVRVVAALAVRVRAAGVLGCGAVPLLPGETGAGAHVGVAHPPRRPHAAGVVQLPNFALAAPMVVLVVATVRREVGVLRSAGVAPLRSALTLHMACLLAVGLCVVHIQVLTRFLSACPPLYWYVAHRLDVGKGVRAGWELYYFGAYCVLGSMLFPTFYPWT